jgi:hypothetical protein
VNYMYLMPSLLVGRRHQMLVLAIQFSRNAQNRLQQFWIATALPGRRSGAGTTEPDCPLLNSQGAARSSSLQSGRE